MAESDRGRKERERNGIRKREETEFKLRMAWRDGLPQPIHWGRSRGGVGFRKEGVTKRRGGAATSYIKPKRGGGGMEETQNQNGEDWVGSRVFVTFP